MKKLVALAMVLVMLVAMTVVPAYATEGPSPSRDELESNQPEDPGEDIGDNDTPMAGLPDDFGGDTDGPDEVIDDNDTPMGQLPGEPDEDIGDNDLPMGEAPVKSPQTGESGMDAALMTVSLLCVAGLAAVAVCKKKAVC